MESASRHQCLIYDGAPSRKLPMLATILSQKLDEGYRCLYLNSPDMVAAMRYQLALMGIDVALETSQNRLILSSDPVTTGDEFDSEGMLRQLEDTLDQSLNDGYKGLWATGDMTWEFGSAKNFLKLLEYEWGLEQIFRRRHEMSGICQYHKDTLPLEVMRHGLISHHSIAINETLSRINPHYIRSGLATEKTVTPPELDDMILALCLWPEGKQDDQHWLPFNKR